MEWRPVETAPKSLEFRCLLGHEYSVVTGYWDGEGWRNERSRVGSYFPATHWMPLPDLPNAASPVSQLSPSQSR